MKIKLVFFGKKSDLTPREQELFRRITFFCSSFEVVPIPVFKHSNVILSQKKEADILFSLISPQDMVVLFDEKGFLFEHSRAFSAWFEKQQIQYSSIVFVLGSAVGFSSIVHERAYFVLSLSPFTWTHDLARCMALEQIYRAFDIQKNGNFHKD